jgi:hypothetical protein
VATFFRGLLLNDKKNLVIDASILIAGTALAYAFAVLPKSTVFIDGNYLPYGVDGFYHAHRILDAALGGGGVQQFDASMHVPEGSWVSWPWGYDRLLALFVQIATWFDSDLDPMQVLVYVPVAWIPVNIGLLIGIFKSVDLRSEFRALGVLGFALLPLTQRLHGIGSIDHHFMELTFVLLVTLCLLRWLAKPSSIALAGVVGASLGVAQVFHHGLFILQLPVLGTLFILWLRGLLPAAPTVRTLAASLILTTTLMILPSQPLWDGQFSMATFSWFHLYVAFATAALLTFMSFKANSYQSIIGLAGIGVVLAVPASAELFLGTRFLTGKLMMLDQIIEMSSPVEMITTTHGLMATLSVYSGLLLLVPLLLVAGAYIAVTERRPLPIAFGVISVFGIGLLLMQYRLNYFGLAFMLAGPLYFLGQLSPSGSSKRALVFLGALIAFAIAFRPPLSGKLFVEHSLAGDHLYEDTQPLYALLEEACDDNPGVVAAAAQFGHYIRFHTDCPVIANNFLLTEQHYEKVQLANSLFHMSVDQIRTEQPEVRYILAFLANTYFQYEGNLYLREFDDIRSENPTLINELMLSDQPTANVVVIGEVYVDPEAEKKIPLAGIYQIRD